MEENLTWIIDRDWNICKDEEEYSRNRDFVHSLGLKCDYVGWCDYNLGDSNSDIILEKMKEYKEKNSVEVRGLRGIYRRTFPLEESEWYTLELKWIDASYQGSDKEIIAYKIPKNSNYIYEYDDYTMATVSNEFRKACIEEHFSGIKFEWFRDVGKYKSEQYFKVYFSDKTPCFYSCNNLSIKNANDRASLNNLGGGLPKLLSIFYKLDINIPVLIKRTDLPSTDFSYYKYHKPDYVEEGFLIRKRVAEVLLQRRIISKSDLKMIGLVDKVPEEYLEYESEELLKVSEEEIKNSQMGYEEFMKTPRSDRKVGEKEVLQVLRKQKKEEKEYYNKPLSKRYCEDLIGTIYERMIPYYKICDGAVISDEYTLLSYKESVMETKEFIELMKFEEWLEPIQGIAIAKCADGDVVLLNEEKQILRVSHEDWQIIESWDNVETFLFQAF